MTAGEDPKKWMDEAEEALNRTAEALKAAWEGSREARMLTLEAAKVAIGRLGEAVDQGIVLAKESWERSEEPTEPPAAGNED